MKCFYCIVENGPFQPKEATTMFNGTQICGQHALRIEDARRSTADQPPRQPKQPQPKKVQ